MKHLLPILVLALGAVPSAQAQQATLYGAVTDSLSGDPLAGANVRLEDTSTGAPTDPDGSYEIDGIAPGRYTVVASYLSYRSKRRTVTLEAGERRRLDVALAPQNMEIEEITVQDERAEAEGRNVGVAELSAREIKNLPTVLEPDVFRALQLLPGVKSSSDFSSGLYIRGGSPDQTLILLDETPVYSPSHFFGFFSLFNPDAIGNVRLYKGGFPAEYGGRIGSVVDLQNKSGSRNETSGKLSLGLLASRASAQGPHPLGGSWMVAVRRSTLEPLLGYLNDLDVDGIPNSFYFYDVNVKTDVQLTERDRLAASAYSGRDALQLAFGAQQAQIDLTYGNSIGSVRWSHRFSEKLFSDVWLTGSDYRSRPSFEIAGTPIESSVDVQNLGVQGELAYLPNDRHTLEAGFQAGQLASSYVTEFNVTDGAADNQNQSNNPLAGESWYANVFAQETYRPTSLWKLRGGLRASFFGDGNYARLAPRLSVEHRPRSNVRLQAAYGRYYQYPKLSTRGSFSGFDYWLLAAEGVPPAWGNQFVAAVKTTPFEGYKADVEAYYRTMNDLFELSPFVSDPSGQPYPQVLHFGGGYATGLEVFLEKTSGRVGGFVSYALGRTRWRFDDIKGGDYFPPKHDRTHDLTAVLRYDFAPSWRATVVFNYATGQAYTRPSAQYKLLNDPIQSNPRDVLVAPFNNARLPPYHRMDAGVRKRGSFFGVADYELQMQVINAYNRSNVWFYNFNFTDDNRVERETIPQIPVPLPNLALTLSF
jgi:hypothetical protein